MSELSLNDFLRREGVAAFIVFLSVAGIIWVIFLSYSWGVEFVPKFALDDDTMHKTVIYYMINGEDFYSAWRHAAVVTGDLGDLRIFRTPLVFYPIAFLTGWAGSGFVFPLSLVCVCMAAFNLILTFWVVNRITGSGWAALAASFVQYAFFFNVIPLFQIALFAMPFVILAVYWAWTDHPWLAGTAIAVAFLIKETFVFALPAILVFFLLRRQWRSAGVVTALNIVAGGLYFIHTLIAQPIPDPTMMLSASGPEFLLNLGSFIWFGFGLLSYNVFAPATFNGYYPTNPIPAFIPIPIFYTILVFQVIIVWGTIGRWIFKLIRKQQMAPVPLLALALVLWLIPILFAASTHITDFARYWMEYAVWRWFGASYVGFSLLVAFSWIDMRGAVKQFLQAPRMMGVDEISRL
ncbi:MAG: glycosyltransferase 87 family protein [Promethearchaeota archaeon]